MRKIWTAASCFRVAVYLECVKNSDASIMSIIMSMKFCRLPSPFTYYLFFFVFILLSYFRVFYFTPSRSPLLPLFRYFCYCIIYIYIFLIESTNYRCDRISSHALLPLPPVWKPSHPLATLFQLIHFVCSARNETGRRRDRGIPRWSW